MYVLLASIESFTSLLPLQKCLMPQEFELCRIFDSMVYEDEMNEDLTMGIHASGALDAQQTRQTLHLN